MPTVPSPRALVAAVRAAVADVPSALRAAEALIAATPAGAEPSPAVADVRAALDAYMEALVEAHNGSVVVAASAIGISPRTLYWRRANSRKACAPSAP